MVFPADQDEVGQGGGAAVGPVGDVVGLAHRGWSGAAGEGAVLVAQGQGGPEGEGDQAVGSADVEDLAVGAEDAGDEVGVAGQAADRGDGELEPGLGGAGLAVCSREGLLEVVWWPGSSGSRAGSRAGAGVVSGSRAARRVSPSSAVP